MLSLEIGGVGKTARPSAETMAAVGAKTGAGLRELIIADAIKPPDKMHAATTFDKFGRDGDGDDMKFLAFRQQ